MHLNSERKHVKASSRAERTEFNSRYGQGLPRNPWSICRLL